MTDMKPAAHTKDVQVYLMEAAGLGGFVFLAGLLVILLEHPSLPVMRSGLSQHLVLRRLILAIGIGAYLAVATKMFTRSGAHMNPSVTLAFLSMGKISKINALLYILSQLAGAAGGAYLLVLLTGSLFSHPLVNYGITEPKPPHGMVSAFVGESIISFIMMFTVLLTASSKKYEKYIAVVSGLLLTLFIAVELPFSGMSMNPARSFSASLVSGKWKHTWIYFIAPVLFMQVATEIFLRWKEKRSIFAGYKTLNDSGFKKDDDYQEIPDIPRQNG